MSTTISKNVPKQNILENSSKIEINLPVKVSYSVLQTVLEAKLVGEFVEKENEGEPTNKYAQIIDAQISKSAEEDYDLELFLGLKLLTSFFKNKIIALAVQLKICFDAQQQKMVVTDYKITSKTHTWFGNKILQVTLNSLLHEKITDKMQQDINPILHKHLTEINEKLQKSIQPKNGLFISGKINDLQILSIDFRTDYIYVFISTKAEGEVLIEEIELP